MNGHPRPDKCVDCNVPLAPRGTRTIPPGHKVHASRGRCNSCYLRARRDGQAAPQLPTPPGPWVAEALCAQVGGDGWFPDRAAPGSESLSNPVSVDDAKAVCARCPVRQQCLAYALDNDETYGIWGGLSPRERRTLRNDRKAPAA